MAGVKTTSDVVLYADYLSQPCRAIKLFCLHNNIAFTEKLMELNRGDTKRADWLAFHPLGLLPCIDDNGFVLGESASILRYLATTRLPNHSSYPQDAQKRATIDTMLDWHLTNLRKGLSGYGFAVCVGPIHFGTAFDEAKGRELEPTLLASLETLETVLLGKMKGGDGPFLMGKEMCIADFIMACEISQCQLLSAEEQTVFLGGKPRIGEWMVAIRDALAPHWDEVHAKMMTVAKDAEVWRSARTSKT